MDHEEQNSGVICGEIVNKVLENIEKEGFLVNYKRQIHAVSVKFFDFLLKSIVKDFEKEGLPAELELQGIIIEELTGSTRLLMLKTMLFIMKNDKINNYSSLDEISERQIHCILLYFFEKQ